MIKRIIIALAVAFTALFHADAGNTAPLLKSRAKSSAAVKTGVWHSNFTKAKAYADKKGLPFIAVWSNGDTCPHCSHFASAANSSVFKKWMKSSNTVFFFGYSGDKSYRVGSTVFHWCRKNKQTAYPFVRIWWKKKGIDVSTVGDTVDGLYSGSTGGKKAVAYFKKKLKK